jgi:hypothetical protein
LWMPASFLFSSVRLYQLVAIAALVYLQFIWTSAPPLSGGLCLTSVSVTSFSLSKHIGDSYATPAFSCRLVYLQFGWASAPLPLTGALGALPSCHMSIFSISCLLFSFFSFSFVSLSRGLCWFFPGVAVEEPHATYFLTFESAKQVRSWCLVAQEPSLFLCILWCGGAMCMLAVWKCWRISSSCCFFLSSVSPASQEIFTLSNISYLLPSSSHYLGKKPKSFYSNENVF